MSAPSRSDPLLRLSNINTFYGQSQVHFDLSIDVPRGHIVCLLGGNASGKSTTMKVLTGFLPAIAISTSTDHGIDADAKEAIAFAILAHQTWRRKTSNLRAATGARRAVVLGAITPRC